jgi:hypothetical protein
MMKCQQTLNEHADKHIIQSIQQSEVKTIYLGYHSDEDKYRFNDIAKDMLLLHQSGGESRKLFLINSNDALNWSVSKTFHRAP